MEEFKEDFSLEVSTRLKQLEQKFKEFSKKQKELDELKASHIHHDDRNNRRIFGKESDLDKHLLYNQHSDPEELELMQQLSGSHAQNKGGKDLNEGQLKREISEGRLGDIKLNDGLNWYLEGRCHLEGHGIEQNFDEALHWLGKSAEEGEPRAMHLLGEMAERGVGQRVDKEAACRWYLQASQVELPNFKNITLLKRDLVKNYYRVGKLYQIGGDSEFNEGNPDAEKAYEQFRKAAELKGKEGLREMGLIMQYGGVWLGKTGVLSYLPGIQEAGDPNVFLNYFNEAAQLGDDLAKNYLGAYYFSIGELKKAARYFKDASKSGTCSRALNNLGICYEQGIPGEAEKDFDQAISLYEQSAKMEFLPAMVRLAHLLYKAGKEEKFLGGEEVDQEECFFKCQNWLRMCLHHDPEAGEACYLMGCLYLEGLAIDQNCELAFKYFEKAKNAEYFKAYTALANMYYSGVQQSPLGFASENQGFAQNLLGYFEIRQNKAIAFNYYEKAYNLGDTDAGVSLGLMLESGYDTQPPNIQKAIQIFQEVVDKCQSETAMFFLGQIFFTYEHLQRQDEGIRLIREASNKGNPYAANYIVENNLEVLQDNFIQQQQVTDQLYQSLARDDLVRDMESNQFRLSSKAFEL